MLVLSRKKRQGIVIGDALVGLCDVKGDSARIGVIASKERLIRRDEFLPEEQRFSSFITSEKVTRGKKQTHSHQVTVRLIRSGLTVGTLHLNQGLSLSLFKGENLLLAKMVEKGPGVERMDSLEIVPLTCNA